MTKTELLAFIDKKRDEIREHVDSVRIFVTFETEDDKGIATGDTTTYNTGAGNWYAQKGQLLEWLALEKMRVKDFHDSQKEDGED